MTTVQAAIINKMIKNSNDTHRYYGAYDELVRTCSDAPQQPTVTVSATGTAAPQPPTNTGTFPPPPSTPTPLGPQWWKERQAEALREQIEIIADQNKKIAELQKQIAEDREHAIIKAGIDKGCRNHANELVLTNKEIDDALRHWGLQNNGPFVSNVTDVIKLCAERGKKIEEFRKVVRDRNEEIESLKKRIEVAQGFTQQDREIIAKRNTEIADLRKQVSTLSKQISQRDMTIAVLNKQIDQKDAVITVITGLRDTAHKTISQMSKNLSEEMHETEDLKKQLETAVKKREGIVKAGNNLRDTLKEIRSYNKLLMGEELLSDTAIALWEDSAK